MHFYSRQWGEKNRHFSVIKFLISVLINDDGGRSLSVKKKKAVKINIIQLKVQNLCSRLQLYKVAKFKFLLGRFWTPSLIFDTPALRGPDYRGYLESN